MINNCPHCGKPIAITLNAMTAPASFAAAIPTPPWEQQPAPIAQPGYSYTRTEPARPASLESDVFVPLAQAFATGVALAVPGIAATIALALPWWSPIAISGAGMAATWAGLLNSHRKLLWATEHHETEAAPVATEPPKPQPAAATIIEVNYPAEQPGTVHQSRIDLPRGITAEAFRGWAKQVSSGIISPARANWTGSGKPFSRQQYDDLLTVMEAAGIVRDTGDGKGRQLTSGGKRALARVGE